MIQFPKPDVEQFFQTYVIRSFGVHADESRLVFSSSLNGKFNLWAIDMNGETSYPYPLTYNDQICSFIKLDPEGRHILTAFDRDGNENYQFHALRWNGGDPMPLFEGASPEDKHYFVHLSEDGKRLYYSTSKDNPSYMNSCVYDLETKQNKLLIEGQDTTTELAAVSPDEKSVVYSKMYANTYYLSFVSREGEEDQCLTPSPEQVHIAGDVIFLDNDTLLFATNFDSEFTYIAKYDIPNKEFKPLRHIERESVSLMRYHKDSRTVYVVTEKGVEDKLYAYSLDSGELTPIPLPSDIVEQLSVAKSGNLYLLARGAVKPHNIYRYQEGAWNMLTRNVMTGLTEEDLVSPDVITYQSFDGMEIEAMLFRAKEQQANGYTVFWPHGGPQAAERKQFRAMFQYIIAQGYNIFCPNFRGSTGYGSSFVKLVEQDWGEGPRKDCLAGMDWLFEQGISSREKLFVMGGSYGGYMTLLLAGRNPEYFRAAIDIVGVSNLFTFYNSVPEHWKPIMELWIGDPERDRERFIKDSPVTYLDNMVNPMLIIQGANDPRVVKEESDQIVEALRAKGRDVEYLVFEDEGHGITKKANEKIGYARMVEFLNRCQ
ncbi:Dipeptidyl aminopeptidase/acylaminoacyl peptidase [Paenibacillus uliginis N3/975]|uniref:Dipeptidyl aminopeptidase/acylaminoacyl peptidase n=1 Tax=Paenibacillus uliginis N3/975 TaxID=1313296 RepID=A0A1X7GW70_9BACL|nr:S9 family peptidase [Paenibacillus uliginis]SMF75482.1 Dipeptidyl aminopeptidase/acylaminoacyl peptidase [Paenibacillus uliginis N3/975]